VVVGEGDPPNVGISSGQQTSGRKPEKLQTEALKYLMTSVGMGFFRRTMMLLHCLRPMHSPVFPSGVVHVFFSEGCEPPPNDICERQREKRQEIIITRCRILSFNLL